MSSSMWAEKRLEEHRSEHQGGCITYAELSAIRDRAYRNGNWRKLTKIEKALYKASLGLARLRGKLINYNLLGALSGIIEKMLRSFAGFVLELGRGKAKALKELYRRNGVFSWLPIIECLLEDDEYLLWLGSRELLLRNLGLKMT